MVELTSHDSMIMAAVTGLTACFYAREGWHILSQHARALTMWLRTQFTVLIKFTTTAILVSIILAPITLHLVHFYEMTKGWFTA